MIEGGQTKKDVAKTLNVSVRTVKYWWAKYNAGESLEDRPRSGRPSVVGRVPKIIITKSIGKRRQSTGKLAKKLTKHGYPMHGTTVWRHMRKTLKLRPYKIRKVPKLTEKQKEARVEFAKAHKDWSVEDWKNVLWTDESPYEIFHPPNPQNDRVWTDDRSKVPVAQVVKHPPKIMVWGLMSFRALSELHVVPQKQTVDAAYYISEILEKTCLDAMNRLPGRGDVLTRRLLPNMSTAILMQDGAPAHTAASTQRWCVANLNRFWSKAEWPGNSPDLNPIEDLWSILQQEFDKLPASTSIPLLTRNLKRAWKQIRPSVLENLVSSMPERMRTCIKLKGEHIRKYK